MESNIFIIIAIGVSALFALWVIFYFIPVGLYFTAKLSGINITLIQLVFMRWCKVPPTLIVHAMIKASKGGIHVHPDDLEAHYVAGGNVDKVVEGLVFANVRAIKLSFQKVSKLDLGRLDIISELEKVAANR